MNLLRVSFTAATTHKTLRHMLLRNAVSSMIRGFATGDGNSESPRGDCVSYNNTTLIGDMRRAFEMRINMNEYQYGCWMGEEDKTMLIQGLSDEVYTSMMNTYLDEGNRRYASQLIYLMELFRSLPCSVLYSVFINGLNHNKARSRTTKVRKYILMFNYEKSLSRPILEYHRTMVVDVENSTSYDEFKSVVDLVEGFCIKGLEDVFDTLLNSNYKPDGIIDDGIVYNLFIIAHCKHYNVDEAYIMYKDMVHYGFDCHMFTVFALMTTLKRENMLDELLWVILNVLTSCNLSDYEILKFLDQFKPEDPDSEAFFDVLAEQAKDGLFLKCSYVPPNATYNTLIIPADPTRQMKRLTPNKTTYTSLIDSFCKQDKFDVAYRVLNEMFHSGFTPSFVTLNDVLRGLLRTGDMRNAYEMSIKIAFIEVCWMDEDTKSSLYQGLSDEVTYTSLINAYLDEGKWDKAERFHCQMEHLYNYLDHNEMPHICFLPDSVIYSVFINGLDNKARTTQIKKFLLRFNYENSLSRPILEYHRTLAENYSHDEFKSLVELVDSFCFKGFKNAYDTILKSNYKPNGIDDGIVYNLFIIAHCKCYTFDDPRNIYKEMVHYNADEAYNVYKEMVHYGFACHMFTVFALINSLQMKDMVNELLWVIQNVLRSCNLNDSEIGKFLNEFNPEEPISEAFFDVLAEKAKDGLFLKCSYAPPSA